MDSVSIARELIALDSVTSQSNENVSVALSVHLERLRFEVQTIPYSDAHGTPKFMLAAKRAPQKFSSGSGVGFFCHTDVVSVEGWKCAQGGPFEASVADGKIWGRGACDMKGPIAAALAALDRIEDSSQLGPLYFFATGDEECGMAGAQLLAAQNPYFREMVENQAAGIIGEPTSLQVVNSHKGGCHLDISSQGVAAHSSTVDGLNANWQLLPFLQYLSQITARCDSESSLRNERFNPPHLSMNLVIRNEPCVPNITVGTATCRVFFRPMPDTNWRELRQEIIDHGVSLGLKVQAFPALPPLHTSPTRPVVQQALQLLDQSQPVAVSYATDGCCFTELENLIVLGPGSIEQAHRCDEWIDINQLITAADHYAKLFQAFCCDERL